jgi:hypothetical protein
MKKKKKTLKQKMTNGTLQRRVIKGRQQRNMQMIIKKGR